MSDQQNGNGGPPPDYQGGNNTNAPGNGNGGRKPDYLAYAVDDAKNGKSYWNRVGAAWVHKDGRGVDINLEALPVNGRISLREKAELRMADYDQQRADQQQQPEPQNQQNRSHGPEQ